MLTTTNILICYAWQIVIERDYSSFNQFLTHNFLWLKTHLYVTIAILLYPKHTSLSLIRSSALPVHNPTVHAFLPSQWIFAHDVRSCDIEVSSLVAQVLASPRGHASLYTWWELQQRTDAEMIATSEPSGQVNDVDLLWHNSTTCSSEALRARFNWRTKSNWKAFIRGWTWSAVSHSMKSWGLPT